MTIRIVLADDEPLFRSGVRALLEAEPDLEVVAEAGDAATAAAVSLRLAPDVVLLDVEMPGQHGPRSGGPEAARAITGAGPDPRPRVLALTTFAVPAYLADMLHAGASGYVLKDIHPRDLAAAVRAVAAGHGSLAPWAAGHLIHSVVAGATSGPGETVAPAPPPAGTGTDAARPRVSPRELQVLSLVAQGHDTRAVARALFVGEATVRTHLERLFTKLGAHSRAEAVALAYHEGLLAERGAQPGST